MTTPRSRARRLAGRYRLVEIIGTGGAGAVWAAVDEVLGRRVAVKDVSGPAWAGDGGLQTLRERTMREARAAAMIGQHPNVVTVYDVVEEDGRPWIVMQLIPARSLAQILDEDGPCSPSQAAAIGVQVLSALRAAHAKGVLHRDVKPSNVLVEDDGHALLTDFGIATMDGEAGLTGTNMLVGAPAYIAPERVRGSPAIPASDLWALGATLYSAVEGRPPYRREDALCTVAAAVEDDPDPTSRAGALAPLLTALLQRDPAKRPTAAEAERALRGIAAYAAFPSSTSSAFSASNAFHAFSASDASDASDPKALVGLIERTGQIARPTGQVADGKPTGHVADREPDRQAADREPDRQVADGRPTGLVAGLTPVERTAAIELRPDRSLDGLLDELADGPPGEPSESDEPDEHGSRRRNALLAAAAAVLMAALLITMLSQRATIPGAPSHQPAGEPAPAVTTSPLAPETAAVAPAAGPPAAATTAEPSTQPSAVQPVQTQTPAASTTTTTTAITTTTSAEPPPTSEASTTAAATSAGG